MCSTMTHHYPRIESASPERDGSTPSHLRKSNKPLLEKKRRARINRSLEQLKSLVLDALKKDTARYSKLEKADILEMTVKHLRHIQRQQMTVAMTFDPSVVSKYNVGYQECAHEVDRYLGTIDGLSPEVRMRLMHHLGNSYNCANDAAMTSSFQYRAAAAALSLPFPLPSATAESSLPGSCLRAVLPAQLCNMVNLSRAMAAEFRRSPSLAEDLSARPTSADSDSDNNDINLDSINNNNADAVDLNRRDCKPFCDKTRNNNVELNGHESSKLTGHSPPSGHSPLSPLGVVKQEQVWRPW